jgi:hypothetical protein
MENAESIMVIWTILVSFASLVVASGRTGIVAYSPWTVREPRHKTKLKFDKTKVEKFLIVVFATSLVNYAVGIVVARDIVAAILFSLFNTAVLAYPMVLWILMKEKKE